MRILTSLEHGTLQNSSSTIRKHDPRGPGALSGFLRLPPVKQALMASTAFALLAAITARLSQKGPT
jgi:hypothetical protein